MINEDFQRKLFEKELLILEKALADLATGKFSDNELLRDYSDIVLNYEKLLTFTRKIFKISDSQSRNSLWREMELKNLLDNAGQGFLTFGKDLIVDREYSAECLRIFGRRIGRVNILTLLASSPNEQQNKLVKEIINQVLNTLDLKSQNSYISQPPQTIQLGKKYLSLELKPISSRGGEEGQIVMLILTDVTEKYKAQEEVAFLSYHDKLTGLYNRSYVDSWIRDFQPKAQFPLSIIIVDMNSLKLTNDVFGHAQGDKLLARLGQVLLNYCRSTDIVARWGGDEFLVLLPRTDESACSKVCERIQTGCREASELPVELSVAVGMATQQSSFKNIADLFCIAENRMYSDKLIRSKTVRHNLIMSIETVLHTRFFEDPDHVQRTRNLALSFAQLISLRGVCINPDHLSLLARLHDFGKVAIPREILGKKGVLSQEEWEIIRNHSEVGFRMAQSIGEPIVAEAILALHERWDGCGYPRGLREYEIPVLARLFAIVDVFDIMTHDRPYRPALSREKAIKELTDGRKTQFDPELIDLFIQNFHELQPAILL